MTGLFGLDDFFWDAIQLLTAALFFLKLSQGFHGRCFVDHQPNKQQHAKNKRFAGVLNFHNLVLR
jgi:hypothetical protein